jgi:hypothetical protein
VSQSANCSAIHLLAKVNQIESAALFCTGHLGMGVGLSHQANQESKSNGSETFCTGTNRPRQDTWHQTKEHLFINRLRELDKFLRSVTSKDEH